MISREPRHVTDEEQLLELARDYDQGALGELYDAHAPQIYAYLYRCVQNTHTAEDITSEVFLRLLQALRSRQHWHTSLRGWLYRVAHNLVVDHFRRQSAGSQDVLDEDIPADGHDVVEAVSERLSRCQLRQAVGKLTADQQHILVLRFGQRLSTQEVAAATGKSVSAVEALQHRALAALRRIMSQDNGLERE